MSQETVLTQPLIPVETGLPRLTVVRLEYDWNICSQGARDRVVGANTIIWLPDSPLEALGIKAKRRAVSVEPAKLVDGDDSVFRASITTSAITWARSVLPPFELVLGSKRGTRPLIMMRPDALRTTAERFSPAVTVLDRGRRWTTGEANDGIVQQSNYSVGMHISPSMEIHFWLRARLAITELVWVPPTTADRILAGGLHLRGVEASIAMPHSSLYARCVSL